MLLNFLREILGGRETALTANFNSCSCVSLVRVNRCVLYLCGEPSLVYWNLGWNKSPYGIVLLYPLAIVQAEWLEWELNGLCQTLNLEIQKYDLFLLERVKTLGCGCQSNVNYVLCLYLWARIGCPV